MSKHTPGPWIVGWTIGQHLRHGETECHMCAQGRPLLSVRTADAYNKRDFSDTVHVHLIADGDFRQIVSSDGTSVVGNYDHDEGGVCTNEADAQLIAAAPDLLEALDALLSDVGRANSMPGAVKARAAIRKATEGDQA